MFKSAMRLHIFLFSLFFYFVACQTVHDQNAQARPRALLLDHKYSSININQTDTATPEFRAIIQRLDSFYAQQVKTGFNGSVLVGYKGQVLYERYLGYCNYSTGELLCPESPSQLASTSKPFTATAILWLHQEKYLDIDKPVKHYLKKFPYPDITITMLLNHRSGLQDYVKTGTRYWNSGKTMYNEDLLNILATHKPKLLFKPNTRFQYSNTNYALLAMVVEEVAAMHFKDFMKKFIFDPLGMKQTYVYDPADKHPELAAVSYRSNWRIHEDNFADGVYGDKGIYSTVQDLYIWDQSFYNNVLLNDKTLKMAYSGYSFEKPGIKNYGLGWRITEYVDGYKIVYHNGWWHGNNTVFYRFIQDNFTIIVLGNKYNTKIYGHAKSIYDIMKMNTDNNNLEWEETGSPQED